MMSIRLDVLTVCFSYYILGSGLFVQSLYLGECNSALGMQSYEIPDSAITASSSHDEKTVGPQNARIRTELYGGAWCPKSAINKDSYEFLQIDFNRLMVITQVEVQGRFGNGKGKEYATHFLLQYQREDGGEWIHFRNKTDGEIFDGNSNTYIAELRPVSPPIIGKRIRFIPYSKYPRTVCMRAEIFGCPWMDGVVSYYVRQGDRRGAEVDLFDFSYDGMSEDNFLTQGLGQLTDGEYGDTNFRLDKVAHRIKGYEWVGWRNDSTENSGPVEIKFKFDSVRKFKSVTLHCNNYFSKDVKIFRRALLYFSIGGMYFLKDPIQYDFMPDNLVEYARNVTISLANSVGQFVKVKLFFEDKWMMISEVIFDSAVVDGKFHPEEPPFTTHAPTLASEESVLQKADVEEIDLLRPYGGNGDGASDSSEGIRKQRNAASTKTLDGDYINIIIGSLSALFVILVIIVVIVIVRLKRRQNNNRQTLMPVIDSVLSVKLQNTNGNPNEKISNGNMYYSIATGDGKMDDKQFNETEAGAQNDYEEPYIGKERNVMATFTPVKNQGQKADFKRRSPVMANAQDKHVQYDALYAAADIINSQVPNIPSIQGVSGNSICGVHSNDLLLSMDQSVIEIPKKHLRCIEFLGEGQFGEVHLCEATGIQEYLEDHDVINRRSSSPTLVVVKILRSSADERARTEFIREIRNMSVLKDPNIVRVLGVCTREEPICMIVEYMQYGDLNQFLVDHLPETDVSAPNARKLGYGCQIYMASQIASGMKYLESLNMVHRDLATRNCLVGTHFAIKISDFGMSRSLYSADYYRIEGRAVLPIRWMAWESILLGKFTTKSDVWSFGVTLWEILTFSRVQPYEGMSDEQVIENSGHHYKNDNQQTYLPQPVTCPKEIYDLMLECWNRHESERPSFREIHMFLLRKNMGYDPKLEILGRTSIGIVHS
ncbi:hypothetical protein CHS0354_015861 [Potamilus streckersoni]|uniref:Discoidin domain-containing receptor 2 n=1 Tax=Potamilus streckersoni TaxID=2493646 RepID=A0AAE0VTS2_9BIVA|nr:hypothetical protein CHS0354_015861 [Potamilus streckersoni]